MRAREIICGGRVRRSLPKSRGILVPRVPPSCKMRSSSFSDSAQLLIGVRKRDASRKRELSLYLQYVSDWSNVWCAELWSKMWAEDDTASGFSGLGARSASRTKAPRERLALQFFDVNGSVARADRERRSTGVQFSAHGGMAQRTGNLNRNIQRDAAVAGVRVERRVQIAR